MRDEYVIMLYGDGMKLETNLKQTQIQTQKLSLKQQFSLKVLEMNDTQVLDAIVAELEINPVLEANENIYAMQEHAYGDRTPFDIALYYVVQEESLSETLLKQLHTDSNQVNEALADFIIESLDSNGYLRLSMEELMEITHASFEELEETINVIQTFEPYGVCARSLQECILIQLSYLHHPALKTAITITDRYLEELAQNKLPWLASCLNISLEEVNAAAALIRSCNPKPGSSYAHPSAYVAADAKITVIDREVQIELLSTRYDLRISKRYQSTTDKEMQNYLKKYIKQAELLIASIEKRNVTLLGIVHCIIDHQKDYFLDHRPLKGFTLKEAAQALGIHESTVSRTIANKYVSFEERLIPLKFFFPAKLSSSDSAHEAKERIKELITSENKQQPYSDQDLADLLLEEGIRCSRRTVAKYRDALGIPSTSKRKQYR